METFILRSDINLNSYLDFLKLNILKLSFSKKTNIMTKVFIFLNFQIKETK